MSWGGLLLAVGGLALASLAYLFWYFRWETRNTGGVAYFGRTLAERRALKRRIRLASLPALPMALLLSPLARKQKGLPSFEYKGVHGPMKTSAPEVFAKAHEYVPRPEDIFVATQMRCGTTWMQQVVYQIVTRGTGEFTDSGIRHLNTLSPWIDATNTVTIEAAPLTGTPPARIVKTHLPAALCPYSPAARYIYVARHPVSAFASIIDFNRTMVGPYLPPIETMADWFCSDRMYWLPWPTHVDGWWRLSQEKPNVLFVHFEEMSRDFGGVLDRISAFLDRRLSAAERTRVMERCTFTYMKDREEWFEMAPPTMFSVAGGAFMASGSDKRHEDVSPAVRDRIVAYCRSALAGATYPASRFYPDLA
jgi:hypothetical protein